MEVVLLSPNFKYNIGDFFDKPDSDLINKQESILGRIALKKAYNSFKKSRQSPRTINILKDDSGVPFIKNGEDLFCSISHSFGYALAVVDKNRVGVDIEKIRDHREELIKYIATPQELEIVSDKNKENTITKTWVIKEAVLKALGVGFELNPKSLEICKKVKNNYFVLVNNKGELYRFNVLAFRWKDFCIAIAVEERKYEKRKINWNNFSSVYLSEIESIDR